MNTYDFDKTIYINDSSADFYKWCFKRHPAAMLKTLPRSIVKAALYALGRIETKELKQQLFSFLSGIDDIERETELFWDEKIGGVGKWYLERQKADDLIISASPEFLLRPVARRLGFALIATPMDEKTGEITGINCHDHEKVRRFNEEYPGAHTEEFYSDSLSDSPMARIADKAFVVDHGRLSPWPQDYLENQYP